MMLHSAFNFLITFLGEYGIVCFFSVLFLGGGLLFLLEDKKGILSRKTTVRAASVIIISVLTYVFISYVNPNYTCLGYSTKQFSFLKQEGQVLTFIDECGSTNAKEYSTSLYRLQGLNCDNGELLYQTPIRGYHNLIGFQDSVVWMQSMYKTLDIKNFNLKTGNSNVNVNEDYLAKAFPGLINGVHSSSYNTNTNLFDFISNEAKYISLNMLTGKENDSVQNTKSSVHYEIIHNAVIDNYLSTKIINSNKNKRQHLDSIRDKQLKSDLSYAELDSEYATLPVNDNYTDSGIVAKLEGKNKLTQLYNKKGELLNKELHFLNGQLILYDSLTKNIFVISYKTLDKLAYIISCISSLTGKLIWKKDKTDLKTGDFFIKEPKFIDALIYKNNAIFIFEGFVASLNKDNGQINWDKRL